jgi:6-pyruvoyl-tetrahydropterin synthase
MRKPSAITLTVFSEFRASHSLEGFETPHFHLWKLSLEFRATLPLQSDRVLDLVYLQEQVSKLTSTLDGCYLNTVLGFSPTSENLANFLWDEFLTAHPTTPLCALTITLCDLFGVATGSAKVEA